MKVISMKKQEMKSSGSYLQSERIRNFLFLFGYSDHKGWWSKYVIGYTHILLIEIIRIQYYDKAEDFMALVMEPLISECRTSVRPIPSMEELEEWKVVEVTVENKTENRLIKPTFQSCATLIQYIAGISLDCILVQELYERLTKSSSAYLKQKGILGVKEWAAKQQTES